MNVSSSRSVYKWVAWAANRSRICDAGVAFARTARDAEVIAQMSLGGPWMSEVVSFDVEIVVGAVMLDSEAA
jgi:hypothetical protein